MKKICLLFAILSTCLIGRVDAAADFVCWDKTDGRVDQLWLGVTDPKALTALGIRDNCKMVTHEKILEIHGRTEKYKAENGEIKKITN